VIFESVQNVSLHQKRLVAYLHPTIWDSLHGMSCNVTDATATDPQLVLIFHGAEGRRLNWPEWVLHTLNTVYLQMVTISVYRYQLGSTPSSCVNLHNVVATRPR